MTDVPRIDESLPGEMLDGHWIDADGWEVCVKNGRYHREDGPAVIYPNGETNWFINGIEYILDDWLETNNKITDSQKVLIKLKYG